MLLLFSHDSRGHTASSVPHLFPASLAVRDTYYTRTARPARHAQMAAAAEEHATTVQSVKDKAKVKFAELTAKQAQSAEASDGRAAEATQQLELSIEEIEVRAH